MPFMLILAVFVCLFALPRGREAKGSNAEKRVIRVWNVDTFEGGKGSRTAFLKKTALRAENVNAGAYYLVSSYTPEGAQQALREGDFPDVLSFGIGLSLGAEFSIPLPYSFPGGETEAGCLAVPWCRGGYALFSLDDDFTAAGDVVISCGGKNLPQIAAALAGIKGEECDSLSAYVGFLDGKYRYLLGTQRDLCRFSARGLAVTLKPLEKYCDLYQYVSVLSAEKMQDCLAFVNTLLSEEVQNSLTSIGMYPPKGGTDALSAVNPEKTVSAFASEQSLGELLGLARSGGDVKNIVKYLKSI